MSSEIQQMFSNFRQEVEVHFEYERHKGLFNIEQALKNIDGASDIKVTTDGIAYVIFSNDPNIISETISSVTGKNAHVSNIRTTRNDWIF